MINDDRKFIVKKFFRLFFDLTLLIKIESHTLVFECLVLYFE